MSLNSLCKTTALLVSIFSGLVCMADNTQEQGIEISFEYNQMPTIASNQLAVYIVDQQDKMVKTLYVSSFAAKERGYRKREGALPFWVRTANPDKLSDAELDAISGATPPAGHISFFWDLTDQNGKRIPEGIYRIVLEGTLYWDSSVRFTADVDTRTLGSEKLVVKTIRTAPDNSQNDDMLTEVSITPVMQR